MASVTMTASSLGGATLSSCSPITAPEEQKVKINCDTKKEDKNGSCSAAGIALADGPKPGTPPPHHNPTTPPRGREARKAFASVCVIMPAAKICRR
ncbi:hypothetical protein PRUPE_2G015200 [Prunus persica]|uniref:Uncharacterized protein n=1 Tax=Prunus persica TaxID=3760 RepID=M5X469_PRUPE|nr:hypothetical protein PRUPE_2G015200 [Prunus persica]